MKRAVDKWQTIYDKQNQTNTKKKNTKQFSWNLKCMYYIKPWSK